MKLRLNPEQVAELEAHLRPGITLLARISRETFDGTNAATSGTPFVEFGGVPTSSINALRTAIRMANGPTSKKKARRTPREQT